MGEQGLTLNQLSRAEITLRRNKITKTRERTITPDMPMRDTRLFKQSIERGKTNSSSGWVTVAGNILYGVDRKRRLRKKNRLPLIN